MPEAIGSAEPDVPVEHADSTKTRVLGLCAAEGFPLIRVASEAVLNDARAAALTARKGGRLEGMGWMTDEWLTRPYC